MVCVWRKSRIEPLSPPIQSIPNEAVCFARSPTVACNPDAKTWGQHVNRRLYSCILKCEQQLCALRWEPNSVHPESTSSNESCQALHTLNLERTQVSDVSPLASCQALHTLNLERTQVSDVSPLASCQSLHTLELNYAQVSDVSPLASCQSLETMLRLIAAVTRVPQFNQSFATVGHTIEHATLGNRVTAADRNLRVSYTWQSGQQSNHPASILQ
jgi:hypothetical protein